MDQDLNIVNEVELSEFSNEGTSYNFAAGSLKLSNDTYFTTIADGTNTTCNSSDSEPWYVNLNFDGSLNWVLNAKNIDGSCTGGTLGRYANSIVEVDEKIIMSADRFGLMALDFNGNILWQSQGINYSIAWNGYGQVKKSSDGNIFHFGTTQCCGSIPKGNLVKVDSSFC